MVDKKKAQLVNRMRHLDTAAASRPVVGAGGEGGWNQLR